MPLHDAAVANGEAGYSDPETGLFVQTSATLKKRGFCCGNGCRHCPYHNDDFVYPGKPLE